VEIGSEQFGDEVADIISIQSWHLNVCCPYMSSNGEMKMSLRLIICPTLKSATSNCWVVDAYILVPEMLEQFQLAVCALREHGCAEGLHDLLDRHGLAGELVLGRAGDMSICAFILVNGKHTRQGRRLPCPRAADRCIFALLVPRVSLPLCVAAPACDLERRAEDLGAYKFSHGGGCSGGFCDWRGWECVWRGGVGGGGGEKRGGSTGGLRPRKRSGLVRWAIPV
jgi:hypothetical protein